MSALVKSRRLVIAACLASIALAPVPALAQAKLTAEQRVERAEADLAIRRILVEYAWRLDHRDIEGYANLFAKDGQWVNGNIVRKGHEEIRQLLLGLYGPTPADYVNRDSFHITTNIEVNVTGDRATARSRHLLFRRGPDGRPTPALAGRYEDDLIRENGEWKILKRVDFPVMPTPEEWGKIIAERRKAAQQ
jgi:uncharacterized protein (TIGR02246 family)